MGHSPRSMAFSASLMASSINLSLSFEGFKLGYNLDLDFGTDIPLWSSGDRKDDTDGETEVSSDL